MTSKQVIAIDARTVSQGGGCATYVKQLFPVIFQKLPHVTFHVFLMHQKQAQVFEGYPNVHVHIIRTPKILLLLYDWLLLPFQVRKLGATLFHGPKSASSPLYKLFRIPTVVTIHDIIPLTYPESERLVNRIYWRIQIPLAYTHASSVITISEYSQQQLIDRWGERKRCHVVYHGYDRSHVDMEEDEDSWDEISHEYQIRKKYILYVGTIQPRKNVLALIKAHEALPNRNEYQLVIAGQAGWLCQDVFEYVQSAGLEEQVLFTGFVPDVDLPYLFRHASAFAYLSSDEGFGLPIIEAMSYMLPVVTSNASCLPEIGGDAALYADPKNSDDIVTKLEQLLSDEAVRKRCQQQGLVNIQRFNWSQCADQTIAVYKELVSL